MERLREGYGAGTSSGTAGGNAGLDSLALAGVAGAGVESGGP